MTIENRSIRAIALDIKKEWVKVNYAAKPYLDAMLELDSINVIISSIYKFTIFFMIV